MAFYHGTFTPYLNTQMHVRGEFLIDEEVEGGGSTPEWSKPYDNIQKNVLGYMNQVYYDKLEYDFANEYYKLYQPPCLLGGCSSIRSGGFLGRNLDWNYNNNAQFVVSTPHKAGRYATIGVTGDVEGLTLDIVDSNVKNDLYNIVPFRIVDGINEHGLCASVNVVPLESKGTTTCTNPGKPDMCACMIIRYILDNHTNAADAISDLLNNWNIYMPHAKDKDLEFHYLICDPDESYIVEFIDNELKIIENYPTYITNFHLDGTTLDASNHIVFSSVEDFGNGLERYDALADGYSSADSLTGMKTLLESLKYTNAYQDSTSPVWKTEFAGINGLKVTDDITDYAEVIAAAKQAYQERDRNTGLTWQTVHTSIYDIANKKLYLATQEDFTEYKEFGLEIQPNPADGFIEETWEFTLTDDTVVNKTVLVKLTS